MAGRSPPRRSRPNIAAQGHRPAVRPAAPSRACTGQREGGQSRRIGTAKGAIRPRPGSAVPERKIATAVRREAHRVARHGTVLGAPIGPPLPRIFRACGSATLPLSGGTHVR